MGGLSGITSNGPIWGSGPVMGGGAVQQLDEPTLDAQEPLSLGDDGYDLSGGVDSEVGLETDGGIDDPFGDLDLGDEFLDSLAEPTATAGAETAPGPAVTSLPARAEQKFPGFEQQDAYQRDLLIADLKGDPQLAAAFDRWQELPDTAKLEVARQVVAKEAAIFGFKPPAVELDSSYDARNPGGYDPESQKIVLGPAAFADRARFANIMTHEAAHAYQQQVAERFDRGEIPPGDPMHAIGATWSKNNQNYVDPPEGGLKKSQPEQYAREMQAYKEQPMEAHSYGIGDAVDAAIRQALAAPAGK